MDLPIGYCPPSTSMVLVKFLINISLNFSSKFHLGWAEYCIFLVTSKDLKVPAQQYSFCIHHHRSQLYKYNCKNLALINKNDLVKLNIHLTYHSMLPLKTVRKEHMFRMWQTLTRMYRVQCVMPVASNSGYLLLSEFAPPLRCSSKDVFLLLPVL